MASPVARTAPSRCSRHRLQVLYHLGIRAAAKQRASRGGHPLVYAMLLLEQPNFSLGALDAGLELANVAIYERLHALLKDCLRLSLLGDLVPVSLAFASVGL